MYVLTKVMVTATGTFDFFTLMLIVTSTSSLAALFRETRASLGIVGMIEGGKSGKVRRKGNDMK